MWLDLALVGVIMAFGLFAYVDSWTIPPGFRQVLGADAYPRFLSQLLLALCVVYIVSQLVGRTRTQSKAAEKSGNGGATSPRAAVDEEARGKAPVPGSQHRRDAGKLLAVMWLSFLGYLVLIPLLGYFLSSFVFLFAAIYGLDERGGAGGLRNAAMYAAAITAGLWLVLDRVLGIYLPPARLLSG